MTGDRKAQAALWGFLAMLALIAIAAGLVDLYRLFAARNWGYAVAQEAALLGASKGRDWVAFAAGGLARLDVAAAQAEAEGLARAELAQRGIAAYQLDVRVLPEPDGGMIPNFPPHPVRLGQGLGAWSSDEPAVGVYLSFPVEWLLLDQIGIAQKSVSVFAAAGVTQ